MLISVIIYHNLWFIINFLSFSTVSLRSFEKRSHISDIRGKNSAAHGHGQKKESILFLHLWSLSDSCHYVVALEWIFLFSSEKASARKKRRKDFSTYVFSPSLLDCSYLHIEKNVFLKNGNLKKMKNTISNLIRLHPPGSKLDVCSVRSTFIGVFKMSIMLHGTLLV